MFWNNQTRFFFLNWVKKSKLTSIIDITDLCVYFCRECFGCRHPKYSDALLDYGFYLLNVDQITAAVQVYQVGTVTRWCWITAAVQVYQVGTVTRWCWYSGRAGLPGWYGDTGMLVHDGWASSHVPHNMVARDTSKISTYWKQFIHLPPKLNLRGGITQSLCTLSISRVLVCSWYICIQKYSFAPLCCYRFVGQTISLLYSHM